MLGPLGWLPSWNNNNNNNNSNHATRTASKQNDDNDEEDVDALLTQFPAYGSLRAASSAQDWMLLGYPAAATTAGLMIEAAVGGSTTTTTAAATKQQQQQQQGANHHHHHDSAVFSEVNTNRKTNENQDDDQEELETVLDETARLNASPSDAAGTTTTTTSPSNGATTTTTTTAAAAAMDWNPTEQDLWKRHAQQKSIATANPLLESTIASNASVVHHQHHGSRKNNASATTRTTATLRPRQTPRTPVTDITPKAAATTRTTTTPVTNHHMNVLLARTLAASSPPSPLSTTTTEDRQHWMPDQYCKQCYACATQFTVFRRRHHCRLCGQVFCNPCAAWFVPKSCAPQGPYTTTSNKSSSSTTTVMDVATTPTTIRVCHDCYQQVQQQKQQQQQWSTTTKPPPPPTPPLPSALTTTSTSASPPTTTTTAMTTPTSPATAGVALRPNMSASSPLLGGNNTNAVATSSSPAAATMATPKTQNVIDEILQQTSPAAEVADNSTTTLSSSVWQSLSQRSLLFLPDLGQAASAAVVPKEESLPQDDQANDTIDEEDDDDRGTTTESDTVATVTTSAGASYNPNNSAAASTTTNLPSRPLWFPLQRGTSMGTTASGTTTNTNTNHNNNATAPPANPIPPQTEAVMAAEASTKSDTAKQGRRLLGLAAANHLEALAKHLLQEYAPTLLAQLPLNDDGRVQGRWTHNLLTLATRCCATVEPNVKNGDLIDIRPYCKIKVISGGNFDDCAYLSGVVFRKMVSHKRMAKELSNPRIMLLSGGIEFTRHENQIASFEALFEQEQKYMEILVGKILKWKPDILMVGRFVSRKAQELLLEAGVVLIQHVKTSLLNRIARQTGATVISSTDHIMNQFGADVLGKCHRFRLVTFRDNEIWSDTKDPKRRSVESLLVDSTLSNHERQAALAAGKLGQSVIDGAEAVRSGLAKRGVAQTYVMLEGCPKDLGCTIVLRGADRAALKEVKTVLRFLIMAAYSLRLETCYLKERCARIRPDFVETPEYTLSTSLCVNFGHSPDGRNSRPWNGGTSEAIPTCKSGNVTAFDHQSILITSVWMTQKSQCCPAEVKGICYYSMQDVALGQFLRDSCFNLSLKCQNPNCKKSVLDHSLSFVHNDGLLNILVEEMEEELPPSPEEARKSGTSGGTPPPSDEEGEPDRPIATWTYCRNCKKLVAPLTYISERTWRFSFGKFLETFFYNRDAIVNASDHVGCSCDLQNSAVLFFGCGKLAARFSYESVRPYDVFVRRTLPIEMSYHKEQALQQLDTIRKSSSELFVRFDKHIDRVSREARSLFQTAVNRPEHLQTVFSELNRIGAEVDHVARTLQDKVASVIEEYRRQDDNTVSEALLRFPWIARRYLFMLTSAWNEKLSAAGQAITAMRKIASATSSRNEGIGPAVVGDIYNEELLDSMNRLRVLNERFSAYNVSDINQALPSLHTGEVHQDEYDDYFEEGETSIDFADGVDADVMASRRRLQGSRTPLDRRARTLPNKSLGTRRGAGETLRSGDQESSATVAPKNTPGGAVKSAFNRFFNRGGRDQDYYLVDLGIFAEGRPRLEPGVNGAVMPVFDEQWSSIIAYSLSSTDYASQFKHFAKFETSTMDSGVGIDQNKMAYGDVSKDGGVDVSRESGRSVERRMLIRNKTHIKHTFRDFDEKGQVTCKFVCTTYWATQFQAVREVFLSPGSGGEDAGMVSGSDIEHSYIESLSSAATWAASGGKSGASFSRTSDHRFVIKCISRTELQMFLDCAPAYFEYLSKAFFHGLPTVLCKIVGVYQIGAHNRVTGKRSMEQVAIMQNIFYNRKISKVFDLKGSLRGRFARNVHSPKDDNVGDARSETSGGKKRNKEAEESNSRNKDGSVLDGSDESGGESPSGVPEKGPTTLLDGDFLEFTIGRPMPMTDRGNAVFQMSILNDTLFLSIINVLDYSILVGVDEENRELVVGIIDFMRQYDILKQMERVGKSLPMVVGSEAPTIIQPPLYKARFTNAMERYFMSVPSKWTVV